MELRPIVRCFEISGGGGTGGGGGGGRTRWFAGAVVMVSRLVVIVDVTEGSQNFAGPTPSICISISSSYLWVPETVLSPLPVFRSLLASSFALFLSLFPFDTVGLTCASLWSPMGASRVQSNSRIRSWSDVDSIVGLFFFVFFFAGDSGQTTCIDNSRANRGRKSRIAADTTSQHSPFDLTEWIVDNIRRLCLLVKLLLLMCA